MYDEPKSQRVILWLTPIAAAILKRIANVKGLSRSETIEQMLRGIDPGNDTDETTDR
jgi:hypothetical protein